MYWVGENVHFLIPALGYPQLEQVFFWTWSEREPVVHRPSAFRAPGERRTVVLWSKGEGGGHTAASAQNVRLVVALAETGGTLGCCADC